MPRLDDRPAHLDVSRRERQILDVLFARERATAAEIQANLPEAPSYSAVRALLRILETKGYVGHDKRGRAFVYKPLIDQRAARRTALSHLLKGFFDDSPSLLVLNVLDDERIDQKELKRLRDLIEAAEES